MRNRIMITGLAAVLALSLVSCQDKLTDAQVTVIAEQAGLFVAVGWIGKDNPTAKQIQAVKGVLTVIQTKSADVTQGKSYTQVVYPEMGKYVSETIAAHQRPLALAASLSILGGIDLMFAAKPSWRENEEFAIQVVQSFIRGAQNGFGLDERDPIMLQVRATAVLHAHIAR